VPRGPTPRLEPISDGDVPDVAAFLHEHLNQRVTAEQWAAAMLSPWQADPPNHGFHLRAGGKVVGAYVALYSRQVVGGAEEDFCNLAAWCVLEGERFGSIRLLKALLDQEGYTFTDLSPSGNVVPLNARLGFEALDTTTALVANLPWPTRSGRGRIVTDPDAIGTMLGGEDRRRFEDHRSAAAARQLLLVSGEAVSHVVFRRDRRKDLPVFATVLHVSDREVLRAMWRPFVRHLLLRYRLVATLAETRVVGFRPWPSVMLRSPRQKMFKSSHVTADQIDYLYSELAAVPW
jgi:hypothetical protein